MVILLSQVIGGRLDVDWMKVKLESIAVKMIDSVERAGISDVNNRVALPIMKTADRFEIILGSYVTYQAHDVSRIDSTAKRTTCCNITDLTYWQKFGTKIHLN